MRIVFFLLFTCLLHASYVGNPLSPSILDRSLFISKDRFVNLRLSYEGDFIIDAMLKKTDQGSGRVDHFYQDMHFGVLSFSYKDRLDVYSLLGLSHIDTDYRIASPSLISLIKICTHYGFAWGFGTKAILWKCGNITIGAGGRYIQTDPDISSLSSNGETSKTSSDLYYRTGQVDLCLSYRINFFIPYIGIKYCLTSTKFQIPGIIIADNGDDTLHMGQRNPFGLVIGTTLTNGCSLMATIEARLFDEQAITISGSFRF